MSEMEAKKIVYKRFFTKEGEHPYDGVEWEKFDAIIKDRVSGDMKYEQRGVEFPSFYSQGAVNIIASKYFKGILGKNRETSLKQLIDRVVNTNVSWGDKQSYFDTPEDKNIFSEELTYILLHQIAYFNSPVWFNMGFPGRAQQASACFVSKVEDSIESIFDLAKKEALIFKGGSGNGVNLSTLRSKYEQLSSGGTSSGLLSFMKMYDAVAGVIKSGGTTRRAARLVCLDIDHPEIIDFIQCKVKEEEKAMALIREGYDSSYNGEAYETITYQNGNHSVRITDEFMQAVDQDGDFWTKMVISGKKHKRYNAKTILRAIAEAGWRCGDPGLQFHDIANKWNTCKTDPKNATNPCGEYDGQEGTSCNLGSVNLMKFFNDGKFDIASFVHTCEIMSTAMDIWIDMADYPFEDIAEETKKFRTIGLGYANLGALIMANHLPYDSDEARSLASAITSLMTSVCYGVSAKNAKVLGTFPKWEGNEESMIEVLEMHKKENKKIAKTQINEQIIKEASEVWDYAIKTGKSNGFRNSFVTVIAPTGTIGMAMDCDTLGCEPELALIKYKLLAGSDVTIQIINQTVELALISLGYSEKEISEIKEYILVNNCVEGCSLMKEEHIPIFDTSLGQTRQIHYSGHVLMVAAIQPFLSGSVSKTVNMPENATTDEIMQVYIDAYKSGLKGITIYRDNSKGSQPLSIVKNERSRATRIKMPDDVETIRHKVIIDGHDIFFHFGKYPDGTLGEVFCSISKEGSTIRGLMDTLATILSFGLQYGIPAKVYVEKFLHSKFEPNGFTTNKKIPIAQSIIDYMMRYIAMNFLDEKDKKALRIVDQDPETSISSEVSDDKKEKKEAVEPTAAKKTKKKDSSLICPDCGSLMVFNGSCRHCENCGRTSGCS